MQKNSHLETTLMWCSRCDGIFSFFWHRQNASFNPNCPWFSAGIVNKFSIYPPYIFLNEPNENSVVKSRLFCVQFTSNRCLLPTGRARWISKIFLWIAFSGCARSYTKAYIVSEQSKRTINFNGVLLGQRRRNITNRIWTQFVALGRSSSHLCQSRPQRLAFRLWCCAD